MGYFSNGTDGMIYEDKYCGNCANQEKCHILVLHHLHNYTKNYVKRMMLDEFIPRNEKGENLECKMFLNGATGIEQDMHQCSLCKEEFKEYSDLMFHLGECEA